MDRGAGGAIGIGGAGESGTETRKTWRRSGGRSGGPGWGGENGDG